MKILISNDEEYIYDDDNVINSVWRWRSNKGLS